MNFFEQLMNIEIKKSMGIYNTTDEFFCLFLNKISRETNKNILMVVNSIYEANKLGIDMWDLLGALEGLCYLGRAVEIDDSTYFVGSYKDYLESIGEDLEEEYTLVGQDGNAFALMGYTSRCMKECGLRDEIDEMRERAMSGDYYNLIRVCDEYIQRCNEINPDLEEGISVSE